MPGVPPPQAIDSPSRSRAAAASCRTEASPPVSTQKAGTARRSDIPGLAAALARQDLTVLDVRRAPERAREHIAAPGRLDT